MHLGFPQQAARWTVLSAAFLVLHPSSASGSTHLLASRGSPGGYAEAARLESAAGGTVCDRLPPRRLAADLPAVEQTLPPEDRTLHYSFSEKPDGTASAGRPLAGEVFLPPSFPDKSPAGLDGAGAGFWDGSEYMLGKVGVAIILVESDGSVEPSTEDWTEAEENLVLAAIERAARWWVDRAPDGLLSFTYEIHTSVPVPIEPINHTQREEALWIRPALEHLGWGGGDRFTGTQSLLNDMKRRLGLDWAFAIYVVDSSEDRDGMFADGVYFAYAYLGGPFLVLTLDNDGWGPENFAAVCAHEMGHIFYALDQYASARIPCDRASGYLARATSNSAHGDCPEEEPECIMRSRPLRNATLSATAMGQIGWDDADGNGIPDVIDTKPSLDVRTEGGRISGTARVSPLPNRNPYGYGHAISINTIAQVEVRIDEGPWIEVSPEDGVWDGPEESFHFSLAGVGEAGVHRAAVRARNSVGNFSRTVVLHWNVSGAEREPLPENDPPFALRITGNRPNPFNPATRVYFDAPAAGPGEAAIYDARGVLIRILLDGAVTRGENVLEWDGRDRRGREAPSGRYFCRVRSQGETVVHPLLLLR